MTRSPMPGRRAVPLLVALLFILSSADVLRAEGEVSRDKVRVQLHNGNVFEGRAVSETPQTIVLEIISKTGGRCRMTFPRARIARVERLGGEAAPRPPGCVRDAWYLLHAGSAVVGARHLVLRHIRADGVPGFRLEETIEHFPRGPHVPAVRVQRTERVNLHFKAQQVYFREVGEGSSHPEGPQRYEKSVSGPVRAGVWDGLSHIGETSERVQVPLPDGGRSRLGAREHLLHRREIGLEQVTFLDAERLSTSTALAGYVALGVVDRTGKQYDQFVWEEGGVRLVSRFRDCEVIEEQVSEGVRALPVTEAQVEAARGGAASGTSTDGVPGLVRLPEIGASFRLPDATWKSRRVEASPLAVGWRQVAGAESRALLADLRVEWDPSGAQMTPGAGEAAQRLLLRLRAVCPDLKLVRPRGPVAANEPDAPAWRMDFTGTLRNESIRTVVVVLDHGRGRALFMIACPEVSWRQASRSIETLAASIARL